MQTTIISAMWSLPFQGDSFVAQASLELGSETGSRNARDSKRPTVGQADVDQRTCRALVPYDAAETCCSGREQVDALIVRAAPESAAGLANPEAPVDQHVDEPEKLGSARDVPPDFLDRVAGIDQQIEPRPPP